MEMTPTAYINAVQKNGFVRVKKIVNTPGKKEIIMIDRDGNEWKKQFKVAYEKV